MGNSLAIHKQVKMFRAATFKSRVSLPTRAGRDISTGWKRGLSSARPNFSPTPWFVDEETDSSVVPEQSDLANRKHEGRAVARHVPPPNNIPNHLRELHAHLITLPLLDSVSVVCASSRDISLEDSLPARRPHGKRKRGGSSYGSDGVGDPSPIWEWILEADLKEGAEKRGAVEAVLRSATKTLAEGFPDVPLPTKAALRKSGDGWGFLDLGDSAIHILSKDAKRKWFSRDTPESSLERTFTRWY